jgi:hypothetical protein
MLHISFTVRVCRTRPTPKLWSTFFAQPLIQYTIFPSRATYPSHLFILGLINPTAPPHPIRSKHSSLLFVLTHLSYSFLHTLLHTYKEASPEISFRIGIHRFFSCVLGKAHLEGLHLSLRLNRFFCITNFV